MVAAKQSIITNHFITAKGQTPNEAGCRKKMLSDERAPMEDGQSPSPAKRFRTGGLQLSQLDSIGSITFSSNNVQKHEDENDDDDVCEVELSQCCTQPQADDTEIEATSNKGPSPQIPIPVRFVTNKCRGPWLHDQCCIDSQVV